MFFKTLGAAHLEGACGRDGTGPGALRVLAPAAAGIDAAAGDVI